jgi:hypothetical protein
MICIILPQGCLQLLGPPAARETFGYDNHGREGACGDEDIACEVSGSGRCVSAILARSDAVDVHQAIHAANAVQAGCHALASASRFSKRLTTIPHSKVRITLTFSYTVF